MKKKKKIIELNFKSFLKLTLIVTLFLVIAGNPTAVRNYFFNIYSDYNADKYSNDPYVLSIIDKCKDNEFKIDCVFYSVSDNIIYDNNWKKTRGYLEILRPIGAIKGKMICRDSAVMYRAIFNGLNVLNWYGHGEGHIFNIVKYNNEYCVIDMKELSCW